MLGAVLGGSFRKSAVNLLSTASDSSALSRSKSSSRAAIKAAFDVFDTDRSGSLSAAELKQVLTRPGGGMPLSLDEVQAIIEEFDTDGDGKADTMMQQVVNQQVVTQKQDAVVGIQMQNVMGALPQSRMDAV